MGFFLKKVLLLSPFQNYCTLVLHKAVVHSPGGFYICMLSSKQNKALIVQMVSLPSFTSSHAWNSSVILVLYRCIFMSSLVQIRMVIYISWLHILIHIEEQMTWAVFLFFFLMREIPHFLTHWEISSHTGKFSHMLGKNKKWHKEKIFVFKAQS